MLGKGAKLQHGFDENNANEPFAGIYTRLIGPPEARWDREGPFLRPIIDQTKERLRLEDDERMLVLDTCAGLGIEATMIARERRSMVRVLANEHDPYMRRRTVANIGKAFHDNPGLGKALQRDVMPYSWAELGTKLEKYRGKIGVVLCVSNSIAYLETPEERIEALKSFRGLMHPTEGRLVIDARNFKTIKRWLEASAGAGKDIRREPFPLHGAPMVNGPVQVKPIEYTDASITFRYDDAGLAITGRRKQKPPAFITYALVTETEMFDELKRAGLSVEEVYYDFAQRSPLTPERKADAGWIQYVCKVANGNGNGNGNSAGGGSGVGGPGKSTSIYMR